MPANRLQKQEKQPRDTRFPKGSSGNPRGRAPGSKNSATAIVERLMGDDAKEIAEAVISAAKGGDMVAARLALDRIAPIRRGRPVVIDLPAINTADDVANAISAIALAMARGQITPDEAGAVAGVVELRRKAIETSELEKRIAALELSKEDKP